MWILDLSGNDPHAVVPDDRALRRACRVIAPKGAPLPRGVTEKQVLRYTGSLEKTFARSKTGQDVIDGWLKEAVGIMVTGDGYGAFLVTLAAFYGKLPAVYLPPPDAAGSPYLPMIAALADETWLTGAAQKDPRKAVLKGRHLRGRVLTKEAVHG